MIKLIIFDFDGTIADSRNAIYSVILKVADSLGMSKEIDEDFKKEMGRYSLKEHLQKVGIKKDIPKIIKEIEEEYISQKDNVKLARNVRKLEKIDCKKIILTNNSSQFVHMVLDKFEIDFFDEVHWPKRPLPKEEHINRIVKRSKLSPEEVICVGDRDSDVNAANRAGCFSVAVNNKISWSPLEDLMKTKPDFIIEDISEVSSVFRELNSS